MDTNVVGRDDAGDTCPECGSKLIEDGEYRCQSCGLVIEETVIDHGKEWRSYSDNDTLHRAGGTETELLHDKGLSSKIGWDNRDAYGNPIASSKRFQLKRMRKLNSPFDGSADRALANGISEIKRICSSLGYDDTYKEQASRLFRTVQDENLLQGHSIEGMAAACVLAVTRCNGLRRQYEDIFVRSKVDGKRIKSAFKMLNREFSLPTQPIPVADCIPKVASDLDVPKEIEREALALAHEADELDRISTYNPYGVAAASLYIVGKQNGLEVTQSNVADVANVSTVTIRKNMNFLEDTLDF